MTKHKKKGFTLFELLAVIIIIALIALIVTPIILNIINEAKKEAFVASSYGIVEATKNIFIKKLYHNENTEEVIFTYTNGKESSIPNGYALQYTGEKPKNGRISLTTTGEVALALHNGIWCVIKEYDTDQIIVSDNSIDKCAFKANINDENRYDDIKGVNKPQLVTGMTPIKWNNDTKQWEKVEDPINDDSWYDYSKKEWANAVTSDCTNKDDLSTCSMWVWIPRYAYKILHGYHSNSVIGSTGNIDVKFLQNTTNITSDNTYIMNSLGIDQTSKDYYVKHPAFTFGNKELYGIWVAKFEPSVESNNICYITPNLTNCDNPNIYPRFVPNAKSWRWNTIGTAYTSSRNMEGFNNPYGWIAKEVDTHMMKNIEWGAMAYLSVSQYGNTNKMWNNPNNEFYTGCTGKNANDTDNNTCNRYDSPNGVRASTTGNVYGVYDMSGGAAERMMANYDNHSANSNLDPATIADKYIDRYTGPNYGYNNLKYGDAIYETSNGAVYNGSSWIGNGNAAWDTNYSYMPYSNMSWFVRGGTYATGGPNGPFAYIYHTGEAYNNFTFRVTVIIE